MTRIGLTQRVDEVEAYAERRDCLDQRWGALLFDHGLTPLPLSNRIEDVGAYVDRLDLDGIILTGGNDVADLDGGTNVAPERDRFERLLLEEAVDRDLPVLGVCRGLQLINRHFDGTITRIDGHVVVEHGLEIDPAAAGVGDPPERVTVNSYHDFGVLGDDLAEDLVVVGRAPDSSIEWIEHRVYPITAIMWHPERDSPAEELDRRIMNHRFADISR